MLHHTADKSGLPHTGPMAGWEGSRNKGRSENCWRTGARNQAVLTKGTLVPEQCDEITVVRAAESCDLASPHRSVK